jgi:hypothetical protein
MTLGPRPTRHSPCFVCAAFTSIKLRGGAAHHSAWHGIAMIPASTLRNAHVPINSKTPLQLSHIPPQTERMGRRVCAAHQG